MPVANRIAELTLVQQAGGGQNAGGVRVDVQGPVQGPAQGAAQGPVQGGAAPVTAGGGTTVTQGPDGTTIIDSDGVRTTITTGPDGVRIVQNGEEIANVPASGEATWDGPIDISGIVPEGAVIISVAFFIAIFCIIVGLPISRSIARRMDRAPLSPPLAPEFRAELAGLQEAVSSVAVDVERVAEAQRWTARHLGAPSGGVR